MSATVILGIGAIPEPDRITCRTGSPGWAGFIDTVSSVEKQGKSSCITFISGRKAELLVDEIPKWVKPDARIEFDRILMTIRLLQ